MVGGISRPQYGAFFTHREAERYPARLGETFAVESLVMSITASTLLAPIKPDSAPPNAGAALLVGN
jgi:hypothetical protein